MDLTTSFSLLLFDKAADNSVFNANVWVQCLLSPRSVQLTHSKPSLATVPFHWQFRRRTPRRVSYCPRHCVSAISPALAFSPLVLSLDRSLLFSLVTYTLPHLPLVTPSSIITPPSSLVTPLSLVPPPAPVCPGQLSWVVSLHRGNEALLPTPFVLPTPQQFKLRFKAGRKHRNCAYCFTIYLYSIRYAHCLLAAANIMSEWSVWPFMLGLLHWEA